jgi:ribosomal-protein-alanine N-acetyltransferase
MTIPVLKTHRLTLRPLRAADLDDFYEYAQDPEVSAPGMWEPYVSYAAAEDDLNRLLSYYERGLMWWALEHQTDHKMIGRCQLAEYDSHDSRAEISYALHRSYWRQGYITEAANRILAYGFQDLNLNRINAKVLTTNLASIRLLEKLGMTREGCMRQYRTVGGVPTDAFIYAILLHEWRLTGND